MFKGILLSKALTCMKCFLYKQNGFFIKETNTFGHINVVTIYTSHIDHFTTKHKAFEQSAACLSVVFSCFLVLYRLQYSDALGEI